MTAGYEVVPGPFRGALGQHRRFHLYKAVFLENLAHTLIHFVAFD